MLITLMQHVHSKSELVSLHLGFQLSELIPASLFDFTVNSSFFDFQTSLDSGSM